MDSLYTFEVKKIIDSARWPSSLIYEIVEYVEEGLLRIRFYRDNINSLCGEDKLQMAAELNKALTIVRNIGVPMYVEVERGNGLFERGGSDGGTHSLAD